MTSIAYTPPAHIFKAYDIRGIVELELTDDFAYHLGRAFGSAVVNLKQQKVVLGRDGRLSSPTLSRALAEGLADCGLTVIDIGQVPTPLTYYGCTQLALSGIQITGSHNPSNYNGFKMVLDGQAIYGATIQALYQRICHLDFTPKAQGEITSHDLWPQYLQRVCSDSTLARSLKVVLDCGNGVAGGFAGPLLRTLGCEVIELFCDIDGNFPNHHPDPADPKNLQDLIREVIAQKADIGLAFDGDGDRLGVVTANGVNIFPDRQMMLFARDILTRVKGATIAFDVKCTRLLAHEITTAGGIPVMCPTGHSLVKARMRELNAALGGEMSGHIFFAERWFGFDDALYTAVRLLEILSPFDNPSAILEALPQALANTPELHCATAEGDNHRLIRDIQNQGVFADAKELITIDGMRVEYADGFGLVRASNTTPVIVMRFEADNAVALKRIQAQFKTQILRFKPDAQLPWSD